MPSTWNEAKTLILILFAMMIVTPGRPIASASSIDGGVGLVGPVLPQKDFRRAAEPDTRRFELPGGEPLIVVETARSPYAWEGRFTRGDVGGPVEPGGRLIEIPTGVGPVTVVWLPDGRCIQRTPVGGGRFRFVDLPELDPGCFVQPPPGDVPVGGNPVGMNGGCDDGSMLDVLVKWTPTARIEAGGAIAIRAIAEASIGISNHVYATSGIPVRMRAVGVGETEAYDQDGSADVIVHLQNDGDGLLDSVHAERDAVGADLVALLQGVSSFYCGVAYLGGTPVPELGFSCTVWSCALGNLTFTHEIGHNQGCCHAPGDGGGCTTGGVFPYSTGHRFVGSSGTLWRTVMAYAPGDRWPRLSSPEILHDGVPTGLPGASGSDNARTIRETAAVVASFRCAVIPDDGSVNHLISPLMTPPVNGGQVAFTVEGLPRADAQGPVVVAGFALADIEATNESFSVRFGDVEVGVLFGGSGENCAASADGFEVPAELFNAALEGGELTVTIISTSAVDSSCTDTELRLIARYLASEDPCGTLDTDDDGTPDGCDGCPDDPAKTEPGVCGCGVSETDTDGDGTPDCEDGCPFDPTSIDPEECDCGSGDVDGDGDVDIDDIIEVIIAWNATGDVPADCNGDGYVDGGDLSIVLGAFGGCG